MGRTRSRPPRHVREARLLDVGLTALPTTPKMVRVAGSQKCTTGRWRLHCFDDLRCWKLEIHAIFSFYRNFRRQGDGQDGHPGTPVLVGMDQLEMGSVVVVYRPGLSIFRWMGDIPEYYLMLGMCWVYGWKSPPVTRKCMNLRCVSCCGCANHGIRVIPRNLPSGNWSMLG